MDQERAIGSRVSLATSRGPRNRTGNLGDVIPPRGSSIGPMLDHFFKVGSWRSGQTDLRTAAAALALGYPRLAAFPVALVPVAESAEPFTMQPVVDLSYDIEWPIVHPAGVADDVVSGEINADTDENGAAVRSRRLRTNSGGNCGNHQSCKSCRD